MDMTTTPYDLNLRHLGAAAAVGRFGSISAAAAAVNMSQSALTQALAKLERQLAQSLFHRRPAGTLRSAAAEVFLPRAERALAGVSAAAQALLRGQRAGRGFSAAHRITMVQLRALIAVQRSESFTLAAAATGCAQPTIFRAVRQLELVLGVPLFVASGKMVRATAAAAVFARGARLAILELQSALDEVAALQHPDGGRIAIGALPLACAALLPSALVTLSRAFPAARVQIAEGSYQALLHDLRHGEIDILLGALRSPASAPDLVQLPLFAASLHVVARRGHGLAGVVRPSIENMAAYPWVIAHEGTPIRDRWTQLFAPGPAPERVVECGSVVVIRGLLLEDEFLTLLSTDQFHIEESNLLLQRIGPPLPGSRREIGMTYRQGWQPTNLQQRFMQALQAVAARKGFADGADAAQLDPAAQA